MYCENVNSTGAILKGTLYIDSLRNACGPCHIFVVGGRALTFCPCHQVILKVKSDGYKMWSLSHGERERDRLFTSEPLEANFSQRSGCAPEKLHFKISNSLDPRRRVFSGKTS